MTKEEAANCGYNAYRDDLFCKYCKRSCKNLNSLKNHEFRCKDNPDRNRVHYFNGFAQYNDQIKRGIRAPWNRGLTKETSESIRKTSESLRRVKSELEAELDDDNKLRSRYSNKKADSKTRNIEFNLTFDEYCKLIQEAGLKSSQLGYCLSGGENYVLARYNDEGPYQYGNCRFITQRDNIVERHEIFESRVLFLEQNGVPDIRSKLTDLSYLESVSLVNELIEKIRPNQPHTNYSEINEKRKQLKELEYSRLNPNYRGERNSQYGSYWITDGVKNLKWRNDKGNIPEGFHRGRALSYLISRNKDIMSGRVWITNGVIDKLVEPETKLPEGYRRGRTLVLNKTKSRI